MFGGKKKKLILVTASIGFVIGLIIFILKRIPRVFSKLKTFKSLSLDGIKDFFEVHELNLRVEEEISGINVIYDGTRVCWNNDGSPDYTIYWSDEHIYKADCFEGNDKLNSIVSKRTSCLIPRDEFYCRVKSAKGRLSRILKFPQRKISYNTTSETVAIIKEYGTDVYVIFIKKYWPCTICIYVGGGNSVKKDIKELTDSNYVVFENIAQGACYLTKKQDDGNEEELFIGWIGEPLIFPESLETPI